MSYIYPILRSLDPHHARIGYLGALSCVATRGLETIESLTSRFDELLFEKIFVDDERFHVLMRRVRNDCRRELDLRQTEHAEEDPSSILSEPDSGGDWLYKSELWLYDQCMPSTRGFLSREKLQRTVDLARWTEVLLPTLELSEAGYMLQHLIANEQDQSGDPLFNLLNPTAHPCLPLLYLRLILAAEMLLPFLVVELVERAQEGRRITTRGEHGLLRGGVERMLQAIEEPSDPELVLALRDVDEFDRAIRRKPSTEENYLRPRLEILVDLGLIERKPEIGKRRLDFVWGVTDITSRLCVEWRSLLAAHNRIPEYLEREFFGSMARVMGRPVKQVTSEEQILLWVALAFQEIGRDFGFTPGRTLALMACLLAWQEGYVCEIEAVFEAVYAAARTEWARFLHYSGGSRFDREFLIRIDEGIIEELQTAVRKKGASA